MISLFDTMVSPAAQEALQPRRPLPYNPLPGQWNQRDFEAARAGQQAMPVSSAMAARYGGINNVPANTGDILNADEQAQANKMRMDYATEKSARMANPTDPGQFARDIFGFGYTRSPTPPELVEATKVMEDRADRASKERTAINVAEIQAAGRHGEVDQALRRQVFMTRLKENGGDTAEADKYADSIIKPAKKPPSPTPDASKASPTPSPTLNPQSPAATIPQLPPAMASSFPMKQTSPGMWQVPAAPFWAPGVEDDYSGDKVDEILRAGAPGGRVNPGLLLDAILSATGANRMTPKNMTEIVRRLSSNPDGRNQTLAAMESEAAKMAYDMAMGGQALNMAPKPAFTELSTPGGIRLQSQQRGITFRYPGGREVYHQPAIGRQVFAPFTSQSTMGQYAKRLPVLLELMQQFAQ